MNFAALVPVSLVDTAGLATAVFLIVVVAVELFRWRSVLSPISQARKLGPGAWWRIFFRTMFCEATYQQIEIGFQKRRWLVHSLIMWGFVLLAVSTTLNYIYDPQGLPLPIWHSVRITGNLGGLFFMVGLGAAVYRTTISASGSGSNYADYLFLLLLILAGASGFLSEFTSELSFPLDIMYFVYVFHLLFVAALLVTAPFTKFVHAIGRPILRLSENCLEAVRNKEATLQEPVLSGPDGNVGDLVASNDGMARPDWGLERCITCYMCLAACPVYKKHPSLFLGPTGFVKLGNMYFNPVDKVDRVGMASHGGIELCDLNGYCQEVCPQHIKIVPMLRLLQRESAKREFADKSGMSNKSADEMTRGFI